MMMPFGSAFAINNLHITQNQLPILFMVAGLSTLVIMPIIGKLSDRIDRYKIFVAASIWVGILAIIYTNLGPTSFWLVITLNILMMSGIMGRMVPSTAMVSGIPIMQDRGAFMSINASLQQIAGGAAAAIAGMIVVQKSKFSPLEHYNVVGVVVVCISVITMLLMYRVSVMVRRKEALGERRPHAKTQSSAKAQSLAN